ncbi:hypothetical protein SDC9_73019 [bioreactor metagenome]|uniref:Uncharacterized protein n=1 Tax=bioreactor metagenome TaxID=1076179 RepID=A0A644YD94_9ZZZZ
MSGFKGFVVEFEIQDNYISNYTVHTVGASYHQEFWIPSEKLCEFNTHIIGKIKITKSFEV